MLGGGDPTNETAKVLRALEKTGYAHQVDVVIGPSNPHRVTIEGLSSQLEATVSVHQNVTDMADLMHGQDLAICAGGQSIWELACLGIPALQIVVASNQVEVVRELDDRGVTRSLGEASSLTASELAVQFRRVESQPSLRMKMRRTAMQLVDGKGADRVLQTLISLTH
jgi:UDP-2,4-diacetamido-2,4,6-trideoxy-beta-L-altropyranose hydrolase